ncbi:hypothetical protein ABI59_20135 [Acidobacteria bacterium Mor1]|nr:hypothetical protein ABI59_20135 [Acidobacteria bacterium Mor1]
MARDAWRRELRFAEAVDPGRSLRSTRISQQEIDQGRWTVEELFAVGGRVFDATFTIADGLGDGGGLLRVHRGERGGPDAFGCRDCHFRGGPAGSGDASANAYLTGDGATQRSALSRNPPSLAGAGLVELLAAEMSRELQAIRTRLAEQASRSGESARGKLTALGVEFGWLTVGADGRLDAKEVEGVDADLVLRPFGRKGRFATLRETIEEKLRIHHGMQTTRLAASGDPARVGAHRRPDPDGDGIVDEIVEGQLTALTTFVALQEMPTVEPPQGGLVPVTMWAEGRRRFESLGCASCHTVSLRLERPTLSLPSREADAALKLDLSRDGRGPRLQLQTADESYRVFLHSDLKRHDMGPALAESRDEAGIPRGQFITPPLWGLSRSGPWLHDGRAPTIEDAILLHGGEAQASRDRFAALSEKERASLRVYLTSLTRARRLVAP